MEQSSTAWAAVEFGSASLGDPRRTRRLIAVAGALAGRPAGRVTRAFEDLAEREGAYRFVENRRFSWTGIATSMHAAAAARAASFRQVIVPIDGVAFSVVSREDTFGPVSNKTYPHGVQAMTALALTPDGVPVGVLGHRWWMRSMNREPNKERRPIEERETKHWLGVLDQAVAALRRHAPQTRPWFQIDRGGDCADVLLHALELGVDVTARSCYDRVVTGGRLWGKAAAGTFLGTYRLPIAKPGTQRRIATLSVRARDVEVHLLRGRLKPACKRMMRVVEVREQRSGPDRIHWRLLTTMRVDTFARAMSVITAYTRRWRIEEFHLAWKSGACGVEQSWMRKPEHFYKWATILSAVAVRLERIKLLSRTEPERSALDEFTPDEIDAAIALRKPKGVSFGAIPSLGEMTRWIADIGGYTGKSSGGPPGIRVLGYGLERVITAAMAIASVRNDRANRG